MLVGSNTKPVGHAVPAVTTPITVTSMGGVLIQLSLARRAMRAGLNNRSSSSSSSLYHILAHGGPHNTRNAVPKWTQHGWLAGCDTFSLTASPHPSARRSLRRSCQDISFPVSLVSCLCCFCFSSFSRAELSHIRTSRTAFTKWGTIALIQRRTTNFYSVGFILGMRGTTMHTTGLVS